MIRTLFIVLMWTLIFLWWRRLGCGEGAEDKPFYRQCGWNRACRFSLLARERDVWRRAAMKEVEELAAVRWARLKEEVSAERRTRFSVLVEELERKKEELEEKMAEEMLEEERELRITRDILREAHESAWKEARGKEWEREQISLEEEWTRVARARVDRKEREMEEEIEELLTAELETDRAKRMRRLEEEMSRRGEENLAAARRVWATRKEDGLKEVEEELDRRYEAGWQSRKIALSRDIAVKREEEWEKIVENLEEMEAEKREEDMFALAEERTRERSEMLAELEEIMRLRGIRLRREADETLRREVAAERERENRAIQEAVSELRASREEEMSEELDTWRGEREASITQEIAVWERSTRENRKAIIDEELSSERSRRSAEIDAEMEELEESARQKLAVWKTNTKENYRLQLEEEIEAEMEGERIRRVAILEESLRNQREETVAQRQVLEQVRGELRAEHGRVERMKEERARQGFLSILPPNPNEISMLNRVKVWFNFSPVGSDMVPRHALGPHVGQPMFKSQVQYVTFKMIPRIGSVRVGIDTTKDNDLWVTDVLPMLDWIEETRAGRKVIHTVYVNNADKFFTVRRF